MSFIKFIRKIINPLGLNLVIFPNEDLRRRKKLLDFHKINKILDVGANSGQYALQTFELGFKGNIMSFEPVKSTFDNLKKETLKKQNWKAFNFGFGDKEESIDIN